MQTFISRIYGNYSNKLIKKINNNITKNNEETIYSSTFTFLIKSNYVIFYKAKFIPIYIIHIYL